MLGDNLACIIDMLIENLCIQILFVVIVETIALLILGVFLYFMAILYENIIKKDDYFIDERKDVKIKRLGFYITLFMLLVTIVFYSWGENSDFLVMLAALMATVGWIITNYLTCSNSIRQHTVNILTEIRLSSEFMHNANLLQSIFDKKIIVDMKYYNDLGNIENGTKIRDSIRFILNYLEFVSVGIRMGDLDERLIIEYQRGMFIRAYEQCEPFIREQSENSKTTFRNLIITYNRFKDNKI